jgi:hypothetical protein
MKSVLLYSCCPHTEVEETFWSALAHILALQDIKLYFWPTSNTTSALCTIPPFSPWTFSRTEDPSLSLAAFDQRCHEFGMVYTAGKAPQWTALLSLVLSTTQPSLVIIWNGEHPEELLLREMLRQNRCPVLLAERTPWPGMVSIDPEGILCNASFFGQRPKWANLENQLKWKCLYEEYERWINTVGITWWEQPQAANPVLDRLAEIKRQGRRVVLFAGQVDADTQSFLFSPHFSSNLEAFRWFVDALKPFPDVFILGKHHPKSSTPATAYQQLLAADRGEWRTDLPLNDCLRLSDRLAAVNSSILCEGLIHRKPVIALGRTMLQGSGAVIEVSNRDDHAAVISWLARSSPLPDELTEVWKDFSSWHFAQSLYAFKAFPQLMEERGPAILAQQVAAACKAAQPVYQVGVTAPERVLAHVQRMEAELCELRPQLSAQVRENDEIKASRSFRIARHLMRLANLIYPVRK